MASGTNIFLASAGAAVVRAAWSRYKQWKLDSVPEHERDEYLERQRQRSAWAWYRLPYYVLGMIIVIGLLAAVLSHFF